MITVGDLVRGLLTGGAVGASLAALVVGAIIGDWAVVGAGLGLPAVCGLLVRLAGAPRRAREAALAPRVAVAKIESLRAVACETSDVPVRFDLTVAPDDGRAFRVEFTQEVNHVDLGGHRPGGIVVVEYPPDRPGRARIVRRPTPEWEERAARASVESASGPAIVSDPPQSGAAGFVTLFGLLLAAAAVVWIFRVELFETDGESAALVPSITMGWHGYLALWCGLFGVVALVGYARSLAGATRAQRAVRAVGRVEQVRRPGHGSSGRDGIAVVVRFRDPATGEDRVVTNDGERGERITEAWVGREIGVRYPPGRPHAYRFTSDLDEGGSGRGWPNFAVFLVYAGLVTGAAIEWGWPWALVGAGVPWTVSGLRYLPENARIHRDRIAAFTAAPPVDGRVVALLEDTTTDDDGHTSTRKTPVVVFTTGDGREVTAFATLPAGSRGPDVTVHHTPADPAVFTLDLAAEHGNRRWDAVFVVVALLVGCAAVVVGAVLLGSS